MSSDYLQILVEGKDSFFQNVQDTFGKSIVDEIFTPIEHSLEELFRLEEENDVSISSILNIVQDNIDESTHTDNERKKIEEAGEDVYNSLP